MGLSPEGNDPYSYDWGVGSVHCRVVLKFFECLSRVFASAVYQRSSICLWTRPVSAGCYNYTCRISVVCRLNMGVYLMDSCMYMTI